jgi:hypothetical protein
MTYEPKDYTKRGTCRCCQTEYNIQVFQCGEGYGGYVYQPCPKCHYNPQLEHMIHGKIEREVKFELTTERKSNIKVNADELTDLIVKSLLENYWPKGDESK